MDSGETVSLVAPAVESARAADRSRERAGTLLPWLIGCCYVLGAVAVTCRLWVDPAGRAQIGDVQDVNLFAWFMRYEATAIAHGRLPALTTAALNPPHGVSLMWNTSVLLPGVLLAPVTLLAGPQTSLTVMLTLGFAGSATSLFVVLRRWGVSLTAAAIGGAVYGFSPALLNSGIGHYNLQFAVLPPLIIDALLRIATGRGSAARTGAWLGVLASAQLFTGEELLSDTALAALVLIVVLVAGQPRAVRVRARHAGIGIATGAAVMLVICGHAMWAQFHGPLTEHYQPRYTHYTSYLSAHPAVFVTPAENLLFHTPASAAAAARYPAHLPEYLAYLGWPLLLLLVAAAIRYRQHPPVRVMALTFAVLELLSLGGSYRVVGPFLPWHWLQGLPVLGELIPDRLAILADGAAAAMLAFALDRARRAAGLAERRRGHRVHLATVAAVLAVLPLTPLPYAVAAPAPLPAGWRAAFARLHLAPDARVLVVPIPEEHFTQPLRWQADTAEPASMIGGYFLGPNRAGQTRVSPGLAGADAQYLDPLWTGKAPSARRSLAQLRADVASWHPAAVIDVARGRYGLGPVLTALFGRPAFRSGRLLVWRP
jgi:hypothetical protein